MSAISSLVPARFLTIIAHFVIVVTIFWSRVSKTLCTISWNWTTMTISLYQCYVGVFWMCLTGKQCEGLLTFGFYPRAVWQWRQKVRKQMKTARAYNVRHFWVHKHTQHLICLCLSQIGGGIGCNPRYVCHRAGWILLRSVHVQLQPRSSVYPLLLLWWPLIVDAWCAFVNRS